MSTPSDFVTCKWSAKELFGKRVAFQQVWLNGVLDKTGTLHSEATSEMPKGTMRLHIHHDSPGRQDERVVTVFKLTQAAADSLTKNEDGSFTLGTAIQPQ